MTSTQFPPPATSYPLCLHSLADSWSSPRKSSPLESGKSNLLAARDSCLPRASRGLPACPEPRGACPERILRRSQNTATTTFRINTGSVDILPDEGMPQAIEVVG